MAEGNEEHAGQETAFLYGKAPLFVFWLKLPAGVQTTCRCKNNVSSSFSTSSASLLLAFGATTTTTVDEEASPVFHSLFGPREQTICLSTFFCSRMPQLARPLSVSELATR